MYNKEQCFIANDEAHILRDSNELPQQYKIRMEKCIREIEVLCADCLENSNTITILLNKGYCKQCKKIINKAL